MKKNHPDPDIGAPGTQSHMASATDFTGIAQNLAHDNEELADISDLASMGQDPHVAAHNTQRMKDQKNH